MEPRDETARARLIPPSPGQEPTRSFLEELGLAEHLVCFVRLPFFFAVENATLTLSWHRHDGTTTGKVPVLRSYRQVRGDVTTVIPDSVAQLLASRLSETGEVAATADSVIAAVLADLSPPGDAELELVETVTEFWMPAAVIQEAKDIIAQALSRDALLLNSVTTSPPHRLVHTSDLPPAIPFAVLSAERGFEMRSEGVLQSPFRCAAPTHEVATASSDVLSRHAQRRASGPPALLLMETYASAARSHFTSGRYGEAVVAAQTAAEVLIYELGHRLNADGARTPYGPDDSLADHLNKMQHDLGGTASNWLRDTPGKDPRLHHYWVHCKKLRDAHLHSGREISRTEAAAALSSLSPMWGLLVDVVRRKRKAFPSCCELLSALEPHLRTTRAAQ